MADDDRLDQVYREVRTRPTQPHPGEEAWERLAMGELAASERDALMDHVTRCFDCGEVYRGLQELEREARAFDPGVPRRQRTGVASPVWYSGLAAAVAVVVASALSFWSNRPAPGPGEDVLRSAPAIAPELLHPVGRLASPPQRLEWRAFAGADRYRVEIACGDALWSSEPVSVTHLEWPRQVSLAPGTTCYWRVIALAGADRRLETDVASALVSFEMTGR